MELLALKVSAMCLLLPPVYSLIADPCPYLKANANGRKLREMSDENGQLRFCCGCQEGYKLVLPCRADNFATTVCEECEVGTYIFEQAHSNRVCEVDTRTTKPTTRVTTTTSTISAVTTTTTQAATTKTSTVRVSTTSNSPTTKGLSRITRKGQTGLGAVPRIQEETTRYKRTTTIDRIAETTNDETNETDPTVFILVGLVMVLALGILVLLFFRKILKSKIRGKGNHTYKGKRVSTCSHSYDSIPSAANGVTVEEQSTNEFRTAVETTSRDDRELIPDRSLIQSNFQTQPETATNPNSGNSTTVQKHVRNLSDDLRVDLKQSKTRHNEPHKDHQSMVHESTAKFEPKREARQLTKAMTPESECEGFDDSRNSDVESENPTCSRYHDDGAGAGRRSLPQLQRGLSERPLDEQEMQMRIVKEFMNNIGYAHPDIVINENQVSHFGRHFGISDQANEETKKIYRNNTLEFLNCTFREIHNRHGSTLNAETIIAYFKKVRLTLLAEKLEKELKRRGCLKPATDEEALKKTFFESNV